MPILAYMIGALFMKITMIFTTSEFAIVIAARFVSVICNTLTVIMVIKIAEKLFKGAYRWLFVCFIAFLPQFAFLGSYINNDSLALFSISVIIYGWILGIENKWNLKACITLAVGVGICALSYYNAYGYILFSVIFFVFSLWMMNRDMKEIFKKGLLISAIFLLIAGWWFIRNAVIYQGDFLGLKTEEEYSEKYAMLEFKPSERKTPQNEGNSLFHMLFEDDWLKWTYCSFIGLFGYMNIITSGKIYISYFITFVIAFIGCLYRDKKTAILS